MELQAAVVRFWFVVLAVALLGLWEPALWFGLIPIGFFNGNCPCCGSCGNCTSSATSQYQLDISGISDATADCGNCSQFNGTYVLDRLTPSTRLPGFALADCAYRFAIDPCYCTGASAISQGQDEAWSVNVLFFGVVVSGSNSFVTAGFSRNPNTGVDCSVINEATSVIEFQWSKTVTNGADCANFSSESLPFISDGSDACQSDSSAALVTAI